jgi:hypothetical protein
MSNSNSNQVTVTISAKDEASKVISRLQKGIEGAALKANLLANVITSGVTSAFSALNDKFKESTQLQLNNINATSTFAALTGKSFADSGELVQKLNDNLSEAAAKLPGSTQAYKDIALGISDNLIPAFTDANGAFNEGAFLEGITDITKGLGVLGAASGVASKDVSKFTAKLLGGSSMSELKQLLFAEANPAFLSLVEKKLDTTGKKLSDLTVKERAEILKAVQAQLITPETIKAASSSVGGLIEGLKSNLFDASSGMFGLMRDLDSKTKGEQSVLNAINDGLDALIGDSGLLSVIGKTLKDLGINFGDPMVFLRDGILSFTNKIKSFSNELKAIQTPEDISELIGKTLVGLIRDNLTFSGNLSEVVGKGLADLINNAFNILKGLDYGFIGEITLSAIGNFFRGVGSFLANLDSGVYATLAAGILVQVGVLPAITTLASGLLATFVAGTAGMPLLLVAAAGLAITSLAKAIIENWSQISSMISGQFSNVVQAIKSPIILIINLIRGDMDGVKREARNLVQAVKNLVLGPLETLRQGITGQSTAGARQAEKNRQADEIKAQYDNGTINEQEYLRRTKAVWNGANGFNNSSIMQAVARENKQAPSGSSIVIANSSEAILNRQQQAQLLSSLGNKPSLSIGSVIINSQAKDAKEIAKDVVKYIHQEFNNYSQGYVNAPVV